MRLIMVAFGKWSTGPEQDLFNLYNKRLRQPIELYEADLKRPIQSLQQRKYEQAQLLQALIPPNSLRVVLDETGRQLSSPALAQQIQKWREQAPAALTFIIGGSDGHHECIREQADFLLSLGSLTWPHMLVRALLAEQLWRGQAILTNHPYHR